jgi:hypothetical protein
MQTVSCRTRIIITFAVVFISAMVILYYIIFPVWVKNQRNELTSDPNEPFTISIGKISATGVPIGLRLNNVSIQQLSIDSTVMDSLFIRKITIQHFNPISFLFQ